MKIPNADLAIVDIAKLRDYSLNPRHKEGRHKARVFAAALGLVESDAAWFRSVLIEIVRHHDAEPGKRTAFGQRYVVDFQLERNERRAMVRSVWNIRPGEIVPRLVTCFVV